MSLNRKPKDRKKVEGARGRSEAYYKTTAEHLDASFIGSGDRFGMSFGNKYNSFLFSKNLI